MNSKQIEDFRKNLRHFERELNIQNNAHCSQGVSLAQCHALMELSSNEELNLNELATALYLDKSTVSRTVDSLVKQKLIYRNIPEHNRRQVNLSLTEKGQSNCDSINEGNNKYYEQLFSVLDKKEQDQFLKSFEKLVTQMIKLNKHE